MSELLWNSHFKLQANLVASSRFLRRINVSVCDLSLHKQYKVLVHLHTNEVIVSIIFIFLRSYVKLAQDEIALIRPRTICLSLKLSHLPKYLLMAVDGIYNTLYAVNACLPSLGLRSRVCLPACLLRHYRHRFALSIDSSIPKSLKRR